MGSPTGVAFTRDRATDRLVLAVGQLDPRGDRHRVHVTSKAPAAAGFDAFSTRSDTPFARALVPVSVASYGDRISLVAARIYFSNFARSSVKPWGSPIVLTGTSPATVGGLSVIPGAPVNAQPRVAAASRDRVVVAWSNVGFVQSEQGTWSLTRTYPAVGAAQWTPRVRLAQSAYDVLHGLAVDRAGRSYVLLHRR